MEVFSCFRRVSYVWHLHCKYITQSRHIVRLLAYTLLTAAAARCSSSKYCLPCKHNWHNRMGQKLLLFWTPLKISFIHKMATCADEILEYFIRIWPKIIKIKHNNYGLNFTEGIYRGDKAYQFIRFFNEKYLYRSTKIHQLQHPMATETSATFPSSFIHQSHRFHHWVRVETTREV